MKRIIVYDDYNSKIYDRVGKIIGTITTNIGNPAPRHGFKIIEVVYEDKDNRLCLEESAERSGL